MKHCIVAIVLGIIALPTPSQAVILHNDSDAPSVRPADSIVGQWGSNASCVAIGRDGWDYTDYMITTRHQGGGVNTTVTFGGVDYKVAEQWNHSIADMRIVRLETAGGDQANLSNFTQWYEGSAGYYDIVVGGFGKARGTSGEDRGGSYYTWSGANNNTQRWGSNTISGQRLVSGTMALAMDFGYGSNECAIAEWDSGGGWFMDVDPSGSVDWQLVGLNLGAAEYGKSYYDSPYLKTSNYGVHLSYYEEWIDATMPDTMPAINNPEPALTPGDANKDGLVNIGDLSILSTHYGLEEGATWDTGDFNGDGMVNIGDLSLLSTYYGSVSAGADSQTVPEPCTVLLLSVGLASMLRRRRPREQKPCSI